MISAKWVSQEEDRMRIPRSHRIQAVLLVGLLCATSSVAFAETPIQVLRRTQDKITKLLSRKVAAGSAEEKRVKREVKKVVNTLLDFRELAKLSLGKHWEQRTEEERVEFAGVLQDLIEKNYVKQLKSNLGYQLEYRKEKVSGDTATVATAVTVRKNGRVTEILIDYKLRKAPGGWMVYDVVTDEVSIVSNYRSQFNRIIRKESYEALVKKMRRKLEEDGSAAKAS
jgi:phospholipid transport system substrate-binding protein